MLHIVFGTVLLFGEDTEGVQQSVINVGYEIHTPSQENNKPPEHLPKHQTTQTTAQVSESGAIRQVAAPSSQEKTAQPKHP